MEKIDKKKFKKEIDFKYNFKEYWSFLMRYKIKFIILIIVAFLLAGAYIVDKYIFKELIDKGTIFAGGGMSSMDFVALLWILFSVFIGAIILRAVLKWVDNTLLNSMSVSMIADVKRKYFNHIIGLSHNFHTTHKTGSLISRIGRGSGSVDRMNDVIIFNIVPLIASMVVVITSLLFFNVTAAIVLLITIIVFVVYSVSIQNVSKAYGAYANRKEDREKGNVGDFLTNINSIKYFGKEEIVKKRLYKLTEETKMAVKDLVRFFKYLDVGQSVILGVGLLFLIYFPMKSFLAGELTIGAIVFIYTIYGNIVAPLFGFVQGIRGYYRSMIDFQDLFQYGKIENEIKDKPGAKDINIRRGEIEFKNVEFGYSKRNIFDKFNLKILADKKYALVGHSGCGKSTLVNLLYRLYDVEHGAILIDGSDIRDFKQESVRSEMAIVPQEAVLFDDTIWNNIKFSSPSASKAEVRKAIKFAQLENIISEMPNKENTIVGERGVKLSGGEKQRVSIARAILADKKILVLDEATSSLDSETEHEIQKDLAKLMERRTSIIIAHRLSTIMHADKIIVMKKGKIVQMGTHRQLINQQGEYKKLWNLQKGGYIK
ncbi:MAG: ABC transporter ATP-binding protein/permease [Nanoarchaeota archaeon]|nr:ABC transporter ATP-binding protein/permease [Nanoarchaeota archaeon]